MNTPWKHRLNAAGIHLAGSLLIASLAAALVFGLWYPYPYREVSGGRELFGILVSVDVVLGPLITLAIFNRAKPWPELRRDLAVVVVLQLSALGYGLWTVFAARPVHLVFEIDRFRVVHAVDVDPQLLPLAPKDIDTLPLTGPSLLALRPFRNAQEGADATMAALQGVHLASRPDLWQAYASAVPVVLQAARPVAALKARFAAQSDAIDALIRAAGHDPQTVRYLPLVARKSYWTVLIDPRTAQPLAFMPLDSF